MTLTTDSWNFGDRGIFRIAYLPFYKDEAFVVVAVCRGGCPRHEGTSTYVTVMGQGGKRAGHVDIENVIKTEGVRRDRESGVESTCGPSCQSVRKAPGTPETVLKKDRETYNGSRIVSDNSVLDAVTELYLKTRLNVSKYQIAEYLNMPLHTIETFFDIRGKPDGVIHTLIGGESRFSPSEDRLADVVEALRPSSSRGSPFDASTVLDVVTDGYIETGEPQTVVDIAHHLKLSIEDVQGFFSREKVSGLDFQEVFVPAKGRREMVYVPTIEHLRLAMIKGKNG